MTATKCPVCEAGNTHVFLRRQGVPVHQNYLLTDPEQARAIPRGDLAYAYCKKCGFIFNCEFDPALLDYGNQYENSQLCSVSFQRYVDTLVARILEGKEATSRRFVEVGCGNGRFLRQLVEDASGDVVGIGFDPCYVGPESDLGGRLRFRKQFFDDVCLDEPADIVVSRHVIEHVVDPIGFLRTIRLAVADSPTTRVFIETPCAEWILSGRVVWDFFYEHCSLFTPTSLRFAMLTAGLRPHSISHVFEGQYLWGVASPLADVPVNNDSRHFVASLAAEYASAEERIIREWRSMISRKSSLGKIAIWGAAAKGVTLANLTDPEGRMIDCVIDINPAKQGHFVPGTGHPIVGPNALKTRGVKGIVVTNPNYREEITNFLEDAQIDANLLELSK